MPRNINIVWSLSSGIYTVNLNGVINNYFRCYAIYDTNDTNCILLKLLYLNVDGMIYVPGAFRFNLDRNEIENGAVIALDHDRMITGPFPYISYFTHYPNEYYDGVNGEVAAYLRVKCFNPYVYSLLLLLGFTVTTYGRPIVFKLGMPHLGVPAGVIIWSKLFCARPGINAEQEDVVDGNVFV